MKTRKSTISILFLLILYAVGFYGTIHSIDWVMKATPIHLLICLLLFVWNASDFLNKRQISIAAGIFTFGILIEWIGVKTGFPFGVYHYGKILGWQIDGIPFTMGLNWLLLALLSVDISVRIIGTGNIALRSLVGSFLMLLTDLPMEQICAKLDFWYWEKGAAPMQNYLAWFVLGLGVQWGIHSTLKERSFNKLALPLYVLQFLFFAGLIFFLKA